MRLFFLLAAWLAFANVAVAKEFTLVELRAAVAASDYQAVEKGLASAQSAFREGTTSADTVRELYHALSLSAPETVEFVETWLARDPTNPKAQIARAWSIHNASRFVSRGHGRAARKISAAMQKRSRALAQAAFQSDPYLVPASDALIEGLGDDGKSHVQLAAMEKMLNAHPNWGTVASALPQIREHSIESAHIFCASVAENFPVPKRTSVDERCRLATLASTAAEIDPSYVSRFVWDSTEPALLFDRLSVFVLHTDPSTWTKRQIEWAERAFLTVRVDQRQLVNLQSLLGPFETGVRNSYDQLSARSYENFSQAFLAIRSKEAEGYLAHDPLNLDLLDLVALSGTSSVEAKTFALRRIEASPFQGKHWADFAAIADRRNLPITMLDGDAARRNSVIYATDPIQALNGLLVAKENHYQHLEQTVTMPKAELAKLPDWQQFLLQTDVPGQILCPYLRAYLLRETLCKSTEASSPFCRSGSQGFEPHERLLRSAQGSPHCSELLTQGLEDLWYTSAGFDEATAETQER